MQNKEINYEEIDELCHPLVKYFNSIGLITKFSCQGHNNNLDNCFYIMFDDNIIDEQIDSFLLPLSNKCEHTPLVGKFIKWRRKINGNLTSNWIYQLDYAQYKTNQKNAKYDEQIIKKQMLDKGVNEEKINE